MHAFFITRGFKHDVDFFIKWLETRTFYPQLEKDGKKIRQPIVATLQPIQLWSYVFPEEFKEQVLTALRFDEENADRYIQSSFKTKTALAILRKGLRAKKVPKFEKDPSMIMPIEPMQNIAITPIGIKEDVYGINPDGWKQEML